MPFYTLNELSTHPTFAFVRNELYAGDLTQTLQFLVAYASLDAYERPQLLRHIEPRQRIAAGYLNTLINDIRWVELFFSMRYTTPFMLEMPFDIPHPDLFLNQTRVNCPNLYQLLCQDYCQIPPGARTVILSPRFTHAPGYAHHRQIMFAQAPVGLAYQYQRDLQQMHSHPPRFSGGAAAARPFFNGSHVHGHSTAQVLPPRFSGPDVHHHAGPAPHHHGHHYDAPRGPRGPRG